MFALIISSCEPSLRPELLQFLTTQFVVHQAAESDRVPEVLRGSDWVTKDENRSHDQEDIFENARECQNYGGGLANLSKS